MKLEPLISILTPHSVWESWNSTYQLTAIVLHVACEFCEVI